MGDITRSRAATARNSRVDPIHTFCRKTRVTSASLLQVGMPCRFERWR